MILFRGGRSGVTILFQEASGTFTSPTAIDLPTSGYIEALTAGNFDADPFLEIVVSSVQSTLAAPFRVEVFDQTTPRSWRWNKAVATRNISSLAVADLDNDGRDDLAGLDRAGFVAVWLQKTTGSLSLENAYPVPFGNYFATEALALGDLNHDGLVDIAVANDNAGLLTLLQRNDSPAPPYADWLGSAAVSGFEFQVRITGGDGSRAGVAEPSCIPETVCVSGAIEGRSEIFLRVVGPKPNGKLWPTLVKFSTSTVEVWVRQQSTGLVGFYRLEGARPGVDELPGLFDRDGFDPDSDVSVPLELATKDSPPPPVGDGFTSEHFPGFRFHVAVTSGGEAQGVRQEAQCIEETLCLSGAIPGRSEIFVRIVGPKPNGRLWPTIVKFTTSEVEVWIEQVATGTTKYYRIKGAAPGKDDLTGLFDREGFAP